MPAKGHSYPEAAGPPWRSVEGRRSRLQANKMRFQDRDGHRKAPKPDENGTRRVTINGKLKLFHRVVALAFCPNDRSGTGENKVDQWT